ncbi:hypothetical protein GCM10022223_51960 [Kineosporia mesophila]|uniref:Diaminopimelate decarboxylase n=1 Tax=Kineosporia mesophila TaxID=566012 RepID=A0ABP7AAS1_9ACTN|nr:hypothetical protein [Kineosporia mesophila]MCD5351413.1 hypothetical protein [Kineosporia mesophila]
MAETRLAAPEPDRLGCSWIGGTDLAAIRDQVGTPTFVYSEEQLRRNVTRIQKAAALAGLADRVDLYVPFFPNSNPHVLKPFQDMGVGLLLQMPGEYEITREFGFDSFIVSPGHVADGELEFWARTGCPTFLSSLGEIRAALEAGAPSISARIDSLDSGKPGIKLGELDQLVGLLGEYGRNLECFEVYCGSGNSRDEMIAMIETMFNIFTRYFPTARAMNFAGGHGFDYGSWDAEAKHFDWTSYFSVLGESSQRLGIPEHVRFMFEPARDVLADIGVLVLGIQREVLVNPVSSIVVTDGSRMLMPSAQLRDRRHHVIYLDHEMKELPAGVGRDALIRGRSILRHDYVLPGEYWAPAQLGVGDAMLVLDVGAYCATQHMEFLNVPPAAEVVVDLEGRAHLVTARGQDRDKWRNLLPVSEPLSA